MHRAAMAVALAAALGGQAMAHDGVVHATPAAATAHEAALPFPVRIEPRFSLTDQTGSPVTAADFRGRPMAVFFGYASCQAICSVALPSLAAALDLLGPDGSEIAPVLITVDPARDTPQAMAQSLRAYSPRLIGLTGSETALAEARAAFQVETSQVAADPDGNPIFAHGSFIYLIGADGEVKTLVPLR
ncbi:MAG TPA: SCO family protein [Thermohalobaculum sp.]|nr:SCO family protein [Thermohalobaculum sp.]